MIERMNRTLNARAKSMRLHVGLLKSFWVDAVDELRTINSHGFQNF